MRTSTNTPPAVARAACTSGATASDAEQRVDRERIGAESGHGPVRRLGPAEEGLPVGDGRHVDIAALGVGDHHQLVAMGVRDHLGKRRPARRAEPLEAGDLGLDRHAVLGDCVDDQRSSAR